MDGLRPAFRLGFFCEKAVAHHAAKISLIRSRTGLICRLVAFLKFRGINYIFEIKIQGCFKLNRCNSFKNNG